MGPGGNVDAGERMTRFVRTSRARAGLAVVALAAVVALPGCYTKVVDAEGIGADETYPVREEPTTTVIEDIGKAIEGEDE